MWMLTKVLDFDPEPKCKCSKPCTIPLLPVFAVEVSHFGNNECKWSKHLKRDVDSTGELDQLYIQFCRQKDVVDKDVGALWAQSHLRESNQTLVID